MSLKKEMPLGLTTNVNAEITPLMKDLLDRGYIHVTGLSFNKDNQKVQSKTEWLSDVSKEEIGLYYFNSGGTTAVILSDGKYFVFSGSVGFSAEENEVLYKKHGKYAKCFNFPVYSIGSFDTDELHSRIKNPISTEHGSPYLTFL